MCIIIGTALLVVVPLLFYYYFVHPMKYWRNRGVPQDAPLPLVGNMYDFIFQRKTANQFMMDVCEKFKDKRYVGLYQFTQPMLVLKDLELIKTVTIRDADSFADHQGLSSVDIDPLWSRNLFAAEGDVWHRMRTTLSPSFTASKMKMMFGLMNECGDQFVQYFVEQAQDGATAEYEMKKMFTKYSNDVIATCAFGIKCDSLRDPDNEFYLKGADATNFRGVRALKFFLYPIMPRLMRLLKVKIINDDVGDFFRRIVKDTIDLREKEKIHRPDMIQLMMEMRKKLAPGEQLDDDDLTAQALIFFLAGFETASILMAFAAYELAVNPEMQERLVREIDEALKNGELTYDALMGMKYLDMFINETLRRWSPTAITDRLVTKDYYVEPEREGEVRVHLKKGNVVWIPIDAIHMDPELFDDPEKFDPERFNDENKNRSSSALLAFGMGPRICIGSRFALMENKAIIVKLLQHFEIVPVAKTNIPMVLDPAEVSTYSKGGWWLGLKPRKAPEPKITQL